VLEEFRFRVSDNTEIHSTCWISCVRMSGM